MILPTEVWLEMPDGSRYHGETDEPDYCSLLKQEINTPGSAMGGFMSL